MFLSEEELTPSNYIRNSVLSLREASCSPYPRAPMIESISSIKITLGALSAANAKRHFISFSPIHLEVKVEALQLKKVDLHSVAIAFANIVLPLPGGPYNKIPLDGDSKPLKISGLTVGKMICSYRTFLTSTSPFTSSHFTFGDESKIVSLMDLTISGSKCDAFVSSFFSSGFLTASEIGLDCSALAYSFSASSLLMFLIS